MAGWSCKDAEEIEWDGTIKAKKFIGIAETDPIFTASEAFNFVTGDKINLDNQSGINTGDQSSGDFDHNSLINYDANKHIDHTGVTLTAGDGLTGGGTIAANRTFAVGAGTGITVSADAVNCSITQYTDELAQDAVGAMIGTSLQYVDATPLLDTIQDIRTSATPQFTRVGAGISPSYLFEAYTTNSGIQGYKMKSTSTTALNSLIAYNNNDAYVLCGCAGSAYTALAILQNRAFVDASPGTDGLVLNTENSADPIIFAIGSVSQGQISNNAWKIGSGVTNIDYTLTFDGETNDGLITWMEDEDYFLFGDDIYLSKVVYDDLQFIVGSGKLPAANYPTYETFTTSTRAYAFSVDDYLYCDANEIPHWWKQGTAGDAHLHFTIKTIQNSGANRFAKFEIIFAYADTNEVWVEQTMTGEYTIPTGTAALTNLYVDMGNVTLTNYLIGAQITARVKRIAATGGTEYADDVYITQTGIHLQKDTLGSRQETIK